MGYNTDEYAAVLMEDFLHKSPNGKGNCAFTNRQSPLSSLQPQHQYPRKTSARSFGLKTDKHALTILAHVAAEVRDTRRHLTLVWINEYAQQRFHDFTADAKCSVLARRFFEWHKSQQERRAELRERWDPLKGVTFHPKIREPNPEAARRQPQTFHDEGLKWQNQCDKRLEKKKERLLADLAEAEEVSHKPWSLSPGSRRILRKQQSPTQVQIPETETKPLTPSPSPQRLLREKTRRQYASVTSRRFTRDYPPLLERMKDDVAVRRERAMERAAYAQRRSAHIPSPKRSSRAIARGAERLHNGESSWNANVNNSHMTQCAKTAQEELTFTPETCGGIRCASGAVRVVPSSFQQSPPRHTYAHDAQKERKAPNEKSSLVLSPRQVHRFCARQALWEARRVEHLSQLSDAAKTKEEESVVQNCTFRPKTNPSKNKLRLPTPPEVSMVEMEAAVEFRTPKRRPLWHYEDIRELQLSQRKSGNQQRSHPPKPSPRHTKNSPPRKAIYADPLKTSKQITSNLDQQTLLDLGIWWEDLVRNESPQTTDDNSLDWVFQSPFAQTIAFSSAIQAIVELMKMTEIELDYPLHLTPVLHLQNSENVNFQQFIELYSTFIQYLP